jgi:hypothetical protein
MIGDVPINRRVVPMVIPSISRSGSNLNLSKCVGYVYAHIYKDECTYMHVSVR